MQQKILVKAIAMATAGAVMSLGAAGSASADVMYNTYNPFFGTDGWVTSNGSDGTGSVVPWLGTPGGALPFGFTVEAHPANWAAQINASGEIMEVSAADAASRFNGAVVKIDTANGAWGAWPDPTNPEGTRGWAHNTDFGLLRSAVDTTVRIQVSKVNPADDINNFGITVFEGMNTGGFNHHAAWNSAPGTDRGLGGFTKDNPFNRFNTDTQTWEGSGNIFLTFGDSSYVEFFAHANQIYTIALGGNDVGGDIFGNPYGYTATISSVPVPTAVWLFGSGLLGLLGVSRRKPIRI